MRRDPAPEQARDLRGYLDVVWRRKRTILAIVAVTVVSALLFSFGQTPTYESTARVLVKPMTQSAATTPVQDLVNVETEKELVETTAVAQIAAELIGDVDGPAALVEQVTVEVPTDTQLLDITFAAHDPRRAQAGAQAFAEAYITFKTQQALDDIATARATIEDRIDGLEAQLEDAQQVLAAFDPSSPEGRQAQSLIDQLTSAIVSARLALPSLEVNPSQIVEAAILPVAPASPNHVVNGVLALFVGGALGIAMAFLLERIDDRLHGRDDLEVATGAPVLGMIPKMSRTRHEDTRPVILREPKGGPSEAYRMLRTGVLFAAERTGVRTLMVTGAGAGEGKSTTAANLAVSIAQAHRRVILVSADLRGPRIHRLFGVSSRLGLVDVLAGDVTPSEALVPVGGVDGLRVLPSGPIPGNAPELLGSEQMGALLADLRRTCDLVLLDTPPLLVVSDALALVPFTDAILLVADAEKTRRGSIVRAREQLAQMGGTLIGAVLNGVDPSRAGTYRYPYGRDRGDDAAPARDVRPAEFGARFGRGTTATRPNVG